eukprot:7088597-Prymnesium_polylepis.1
MGHMCALGHIGTSRVGPAHLILELILPLVYDGFCREGVAPPPRRRARHLARSCERAPCTTVYQPIFVPRGKRAAMPPASPTAEGAFAHGRRRSGKKSPRYRLRFPRRP